MDAHLLVYLLGREGDDWGDDPPGPQLLGHLHLVDVLDGPLHGGVVLLVVHGARQVRHALHPVDCTRTSSSLLSRI